MKYSLSTSILFLFVTSVPVYAEPQAVPSSSYSEIKNEEPCISVSMQTVAATVVGISVGSLVALGTVPLVWNNGPSALLLIMAELVAATSLFSIIPAIIYSNFTPTLLTFIAIGASSIAGVLVGTYGGFFLGLSDPVFVLFFPVIGAILFNAIFSLSASLISSQLYLDDNSPVYYRKWLDTD